MQPFFLGNQERQVFAAYHPAASATASQRGVVICPSIGHEYQALHWSLLQFARRLANAGYHVMRFD